MTNSTAIAAKSGWVEIAAEGSNKCGDCRHYNEGHCAKLSIQTLAMSGCTKAFSPNPFSPERDAKTVDWVNEAPDTLPSRPALSAMIAAKEVNQIQVTELIGAMRMAQVHEKFATVARIKILAELKESGRFQGVKLVGPGGEAVEAKSWKDFVAALDMGSLDKVDEQIGFLNTFGEQFLETANRMKLGYRDLRRLKKLPEEDRAAVVSEVETNLGDKDAVLALIDSLADRHARERRDMQEKIGKLQKQADKNQRQIDAIVKAETEALEAERDALIERTTELETQLGGGNWEAASEMTTQLAEQVQAVKKKAESLTRVMPRDALPPPALTAEISALLFHIRELGDTIWSRWEDLTASGFQASDDDAE